MENFCRLDIVNSTYFDRAMNVAPNAIQSGMHTNFIRLTNQNNGTDIDTDDDDVDDDNDSNVVQHAFDENEKNKRISAQCEHKNA